MKSRISQKKLPKVPFFKKLVTIFMIFLPKMFTSVEGVFTSIYKSNGWGDTKSLSGTGSNLTNTEAIRKFLPLLLKQLNCKYLLDAPCGDCFWINQINLPIEKYLGVDIVEKLIVSNQEKYGSSKYKFEQLDIIKDKIPKADVILCRDCLLHLSNENIFETLRNFRKSGSKYLITTTFIKCKRNRDIPNGSWRPINLEVAPFNLIKPIKLLDEKCREVNGHYSDKRLALWKIKDINI